MGHAAEGTGGAVPDKLHSGDGQPSVQECRCPGPPAQHGPLHGPWLLSKCTPVGDAAVPGGTEALDVEATGGTLTDGHAICGSTESRTKTNTAGSETKRLDPGGNVATHRRESLHAPGPAVREGGKAEVGEIDPGESHTGQAVEDGGGGGGGGGYDEGGSTPPPRGVAPPSGVVQGGSGPPPTTCLSYAQAGNGGAGQTVQPGTPPGDTIPVTIEPFVVEDGVPTEAEVEWAVKRLQNNRAGGPSRMRAEDLKEWLAAARRGEKERETATKDGGGGR